LIMVELIDRFSRTAEPTLRGTPPRTPYVPHTKIFPMHLPSLLRVFSALCALADVLFPA